MSNNKIVCDDGIARLMTQCVKHEGRWLSNDNWLEQTHNNELPLYEPLKSIISNKIATGQLLSGPRVQANTIQLKQR